jgi:hypothetical protein
MNITTHGKDGTRIRFMENEKRSMRNTLTLLHTISSLRCPLSLRAERAAEALEIFMDDSAEQPGVITPDKSKGSM